jgi:hypothetical protein
MASRPDPATRPLPRPASTAAYAVILVLSAVTLASWAWQATHPGPRVRPHPFGWLLPVALLTLGVGGLLRARHPRVQRVAVGVGLVLAVAAVWDAIVR